MKKKKIIYIIAILVLLIPVLFLYNAFNGNPISKLIAKGTLKNYLEETYPEDEVYLSKGFYNFKFGTYVFDVTMYGDSTGDYEFEVGGFFSNEVVMDGFYLDHLDESLMKMLGEDARDELKATLGSAVPDILDIEVLIYVLKGTYELDQVWHKDLQMAEPMQIHIVIDGQELSKQDVYERTITIQKILNEEGYDYDRVSINASVPYDGDWILKYAVGFNKNGTVKEKDVSEENKDILK